MKAQIANTDHAAFLKKIDRQLFWLLLLMVACFFTWSENVAITRAIKVVGRIGIMMGSYYAYKSIIKQGAVDTMKLKNPLALLLYLAYLVLGLFSFLWSSDVGVRDRKSVV